MKLKQKHERDEIHLRCGVNTQQIPEDVWNIHPPHSTLTYDEQNLQPLVNQNKKSHRVLKSCFDIAQGPVSTDNETKDDLVSQHKRGTGPWNITHTITTDMSTLKTTTEDLKSSYTSQWKRCKNKTPEREVFFNNPHKYTNIKSYLIKAAVFFLESLRGKREMLSEIQFTERWINEYNMGSLVYFSHAHKKGMNVILRLSSDWVNPGSKVNRPVKTHPVRVIIYSTIKRNKWFHQKKPFFWGLLYSLHPHYYYCNIIKISFSLC